MDRVEQQADGRLVGVDVGGTKVLAALVDDSGSVIRRARAATPSREAPATELESVIAAVVRELVADDSPSAVGLAVAGFVDAAGECVRFAPHLALRDHPLRIRMEERLGVPVHLDNDANAALEGERRFGAAVGADQAALVALGTGIGAALLVGGRLVRGAGGMAGELGHVNVARDGRACPCGLTGCWEQYVSGRALQRAYAQRAGRDVPGPEVTALALDGDAAAIDAYAEMGRWLGLGLVGLVAAFDPSLLVIGGGVAAAGDLLLAPARKALAAGVPGAAYRVMPDVAAARLGTDAGVVGAASAARDLLAQI